MHFHKKATFIAFVLISPISLTADIFQMLKISAQDGFNQNNLTSSDLMVIRNG